MKSKEVSKTQRTLNIWAITVFIWSIYRYYFKTSLPIWFDEFIAKPAVFLLPLTYYINKYEKQEWLTALDLKFRHISKDVIIGLAVGLIFFVSGALGYWTKYQSFELFDRLNPMILGYFLFISFASSFTEEILSRGFVLKRLYEESKNIFSSSFFASFLFFFLHVPILFSNPEMKGTLLIQVMITDLVLSLAISLIYLLRRNVIVPIIIHTLYNLSIYIFITSF